MGCSQSVSTSEVSGYSIDEEILPALEIYKGLHGDNISNNFIVPDNAQWPERFHGMPLGLIVSLI